MTPTIERRAAALEVRASGRRLAGTVARFGVEARIGSTTEVIKPGAFSASLRNGDDILALVDHDTTKVIARTKAGSLKLRETAEGLEFETADLPDTTAANDVLALVRSGNHGGASFGFLVRENGERWTGRKRELLDIDLREVSIVSAWPAYPQTSVTARSRMSEPPRLRLARLFLDTV